MLGFVRYTYFRESAQHVTNRFKGKQMFSTDTKFLIQSELFPPRVSKVKVRMRFSYQCVRDEFHENCYLTITTVLDNSLLVTFSPAKLI